MRFHEFKILREAITPMGDLADIAGLLGTMQVKPGEISGADNTQQTNIGQISAVKNKVLASQISEYLASKMDDVHRLGILANIQGESGFDSGVLGDGKTSGGLFQHHATRFTNLVNKLGKNWATDWKGQIDFALSEPAGREYLAKRFKSAEDAAQWFTINFEVPANKYSVAASRAGLIKNFS